MPPLTNGKEWINFSGCTETQEEKNVWTKRFFQNSKYKITNNKYIN